jgi:hypothetical protein
VERFLRGLAQTSFRTILGRFFTGFRFVAGFLPGGIVNERRIALSMRSAISASVTGCSDPVFRVKRLIPQAFSAPESLFACITADGGVYWWG